MNTSPTGNEGPSLRGPWQYGISRTHIEHCIANNIHGNSNTNRGNVSNSYDNITNLGIDEESLRIQAWLSPLDSDPKRPVRTIVRTMGRQSGQSGRGFQKPGSVRPKPQKPADAQAKPTDAQAKLTDVLAKPADA